MKLPLASRELGRPRRRASMPVSLVFTVFAALAACSLALLLLGCGATKRIPGKTTLIDSSSAEGPGKRGELKSEQRKFIAHEFFLRARQQEMEGNEAIALSYYQIAFEYDPKSRDLCFLLAEKLKGAGKMDSAVAVGLNCLALPGQADSREYQIVAEAYLRKGNVPVALAYYRRALEKDENDKDLLYTLATLYESLKDISKHVDMMDRLLPKIDYPMRLVEKQGQSLKVLGRIDAIAKLYRDAWDKTDNPLFGEKLASFYEDEEMYASLLDALRELIAEDEDNRQYELQKARALTLVGQVDSALATYQALLRKSPDEREFINPYASLLFEKGKFVEAKALFQKLSKGQPDNAVYHFFLGCIGIELKEMAFAEGEIKKAIDLDGRVPEYWAKLASHYIREGHEKKALDLLGKMGQALGNERAGSDAKDWYLNYVQGVVYSQVGKRLEANPRSRGAAGKVGEAGEVVKTGKTDKAAGTLAEASSKVAGSSIKTGGDSEDNVARARRFREQGVEYFQKALALEGNNRRVLFELGVNLEQLGRRAESIEVMKRLVRLDSSDATLLNYLGYMLVEENKELELAGRLIDRALVLEPGNGAFLDSKGWWYYRKLDFARARKFIEAALHRIPQDTTILEHYALILERQGENQAAMERWRQILELDPGHELAHRKVPLP